MARCPRWCHSLSLQIDQDCFRPLDHFIGQPGKASDLYTIAPVAASPHDFTQEHNPAPPLADRHIVVSDPRKQLFQFAQFMVMGSKKRLGRASGLIREVLGDCPGYTQPIKRTRTTPDFVKQDQAFRRGIVQNVGGFL